MTISNIYIEFRQMTSFGCPRKVSVGPWEVLGTALGGPWGVPGGSLGVLGSLRGPHSDIGKFNKKNNIKVICRTIH